MLLHPKGFGQFIQCVKMEHINWDKFPDGWPNLNIQNMKQDCAGKDGTFYIFVLYGIN
jgi:hypothetical protein